MFQLGVDFWLVVGLKVETAGLEVATVELEVTLDGVSTMTLVTIPVTGPVPLTVDV